MTSTTPGAHRLSGTSATGTMTNSYRRKLLQSPQLSAFAILVVILLVFLVYSDFKFLSPVNISNILAFMPELGIIALAMTLLLTAGEFDLSVGAVFALGQVVVLLLAQNVGLDVGVAALIGLLLCIGIGALNGVLVTKIGISSFLVTLSMMFIARGVALYITQGFPLTSWDGDSLLQTLLSGRFKLGPFTIYASLIWFIVLTVLASYVLNYSKLGNWISAIGSNRSAAVARGGTGGCGQDWSVHHHLGHGRTGRIDQRLPHLDRLTDGWDGL